MNIVSRSAWGFDGWLRNSPPRTRPRSQIVGLTLHYNGPATGGKTGNTVPQSVHRYHKTGNGWSGIGYHYLITQDGSVYEGRGLDHVGAHAPPYNTNRLGVMIYIGDGEEPSDAAKRAFLDFKAWAERTLGRSLSVNGHRDGVNTSCPGEPLYRWIKAGLPAPGVPAPAWDGKPIRGGIVTTPYGVRGRHWSTDRRNGEGVHTGEDWNLPGGTPVGTPLYAVADGTVTIADGGSLGLMSILKGDNGRFYRYCHLKQGSRSPWRGERVKAGQKIAEVGATGNVTAPHLHLEDTSAAQLWPPQLWPPVGHRKPSWPQPATPHAIEPEEDPVPEHRETPTTLTLDGTHWSVTDAVVPPSDKALRITAVATVAAPLGTTIKTRWVSWSGEEWVRYGVTEHPTHEVETSCVVGQAWPGADLRLDVWTNAPCEAQVHVSALVWEVP